MDAKTSSKERTSCSTFHKQSRTNEYPSAHIRQSIAVDVIEHVDDLITGKGQKWAQSQRTMYNFTAQPLNKMTSGNEKICVCILRIITNIVDDESANWLP